MLQKVHSLDAGENLLDGKTKRERREQPLEVICSGGGEDVCSLRKGGKETYRKRVLRRKGMAA